MARLSAVVLLCAGLGASACGGAAPPTAPAPPGPPIPPSPAMEDADAILARCPTPEEVAAVDRDLLLLFDYDVTAGHIVCSAAESSRDLTLLQAQTYRVLTVTRRLTFTEPLPWTSESLYGWLVSSIRGIRFRGDDIVNSFCCAPSGIINVKATLGPNNSGLAALIFPTDFRAVGTLMVLFVHEARHNNGFPHTCPDRLKDRTLAEMGAWGVQYQLNLFLAHRTDPAMITASARAGFVEDARSVCTRQLCEDVCPEQS
jgi:hypothetical protein